MIDDILGRALADLVEHPESSAREIARRIGVRDDRLVFKALDNAAYEGRCQRFRWGHEPWRWEVSCGAVYSDPDGRTSPPPCTKRAGHENGPDTDWNRHLHSNGDFKWPVGPEADEAVIPEFPDGTRIEFEHHSDVYAAWRDIASSVRAGWRADQSWCLFGHTVPVTWDQMCREFGDSLRTAVRLVPHPDDVANYARWPTAVRGESSLADAGDLDALADRIGERHADATWSHTSGANP